MLEVAVESGMFPKGGAAEPDDDIVDAAGGPFVMFVVAAAAAANTTGTFCATTTATAGVFTAVGFGSALEAGAVVADFASSPAIKLKEFEEGTPVVLAATT